jgi:hypothetical protein
MDNLPAPGHFFSLVWQTQESRSNKRRKGLNGLHIDLRPRRQYRFDL